MALTSESRRAPSLVDRLRGVRSATSAEYVSVRVDATSLDALALRAFNSFASAVRGVPSVEQVRAHQAGAYLHLVTYASHATPEDRDAIYDAEIVVHDDFPQLRFEFNLIDRRGYPMVDAPLTGQYIEHIRDLPDA